MRQSTTCLVLVCLTGQDKIIDSDCQQARTLHQLPKNMEVETGLAELFMKQSKKLNILPIHPVAEEIIPTYFWVNNFDFAVWVLLTQQI